MSIIRKAQSEIKYLTEHGDTGLNSSLGRRIGKHS